MEKQSTKSEYIEVKSSGIHNKGIFAIKDIPQRIKIIEYVGNKVSKEESDLISYRELGKAKTNPNMGRVYLFKINSNYCLDGNVRRNTSRLINHSCNPNCKSEIVDEKIWIESLRNIKKGEELTYDYGYDLVDYKNHPCNCGAKNCIGYIVNGDKWLILRKKLRWEKRGTKRKKKLNS